MLPLCLGSSYPFQESRLIRPLRQMLCHWVKMAVTVRSRYVYHFMLDKHHEHLSLNLKLFAKTKKQNKTKKKQFLYYVL